MMRTIAILRGYEPQRAADVADRCWAIGMDLVEVPVQGSRGWAALQAVADRSGGRALGAGTVLSPESARRAVGMGASVVISPGIDPEVVLAAQDLGALPLPGVLTPTEVAVGARLGLETCKLFPVDVIGAGWLTALRGPFPEMRLVAVGGVDATNAADYVRAGACGVAFGSSIEGLLQLDDAADRVRELHELADRV